MKRLACQYALLRFKPYVETGEFANVGVVLVAPETGLFKYKLQHKYRRITQFFQGLDGDVYIEARRQFEEELERFGRFYAQLHGRGNYAQIFTEFARPKESLLQFDEVRTILADDPANKLEELFGHYCNHDFATKEYVEKLMERSVRNLLRDAELGGIYKAEKVGNQELSFNFPFVKVGTSGAAERIIKPLNLNQDDTTKLLSHGGQWVDRIRRLRRRNLLPESVLVPVKEPGRNSRQYGAFEEIQNDLRNLDVQVVTVDEKQKILKFAA